MARSERRFRGYMCVALGVLCGTAAIVRSEAPERTSARTASHARAATATSGAIRPQVAPNYGKLPLSFEANRGQTDERVRFLARRRGFTLFLTDDEALLSLRRPSAESRPFTAVSGQSSVAGDNGRQTTDNGYLAANQESRVASPESPAPDVIRLKLAGANPGANVLGEEELPGKSNYFLGNDPKKWRTNVPHYAKVRYKDVYPGIDLVFYGNQGELEFDFVVAPSADPAAIRIAIKAQAVAALDARPNGIAERRPEAVAPVSPPAKRAAMGTSPLQSAPNGDLIIATTGGEVCFRKPLIYQVGRQGERQIVEGGFVLRSGDWEPGKMKSDRGKATSDASSVGNSEFTIQNLEFQVSFELASYDRSLPLIIDPVLEYSTYLGGSGNDFATSIALDSFANVYVTGRTDSPNFPGANPPSTIGPSNRDAFVAKLNPDGSALIYSTYFGGSRDDAANGIAIDSDGNAFLVGITESNDLPTTPGAFQSMGVGGFVAKINAGGNGLVYSTYLGPTSIGGAVRAIAVDALGNGYVVGSCDSPDFPTTSGAFQTASGGSFDAFVAKLSPDGSSLVYSTYLGGSADDRASAVAVDATGSAFVTGFANSTDFPTTPGTVSTIWHPILFVTKLSPTGTNLIYSAHFGGGGDDYGGGITVDPTGSAYVTGGTNSSGFPTTSGAFQTTLKGRSDALVLKLSPDGSALFYSTYLGGSGEENPFSGSSVGIAVDSDGNAYVTGMTDSTDFPVINALQGFKVGDRDAFVAKLNPSGSAILYSTYLGGSGAENPFGTIVGFGSIAVDSLGNAYVSGYTESANFPVADALQDSNAGLDDAFIAKISTACGPGVRLSHTSLNASTQLLGAAKGPFPVTVSNVGDCPLSISGIVAEGDFAHTSDCLAALNPGASCTIQVTFTPSALDDRFGKLTITHDAPGSPHVVALRGSGVDFALTPAPGASTSATVNAGRTATFNLQLMPSGFSGNVTLSCLENITAATCSLSTSSVNLDGTNLVNVTVSVATTARGMVAPLGAHNRAPLQAPALGRSDWTRRVVPLLALAVLITLVVVGATGRVADKGRGKASPLHAALITRLALVEALLCMLLWAACGGDGGPTPTPQPGTPAGTYTITVTATTAEASRNINLTLTVN